MGIEPTLPKKRDFESRASTNSATPAIMFQRFPACSSTHFFCSAGVTVRKAMKKKDGKTWVKTGPPLLWKHQPSGVFYARVKVAGKDVWKSLDTDLLSVAKNRVDAEVARIRGAPNRGRPGRKSNQLEPVFSSWKTSSSTLQGASPSENLEETSMDKRGSTRMCQNLPFRGWSGAINRSNFISNRESSGSICVHLRLGKHSRLPNVVPCRGRGGENPCQWRQFRVGRRAPPDSGGA